MNCLFLFYGCPCSGKDTFIKEMLKKQKEIVLFLYFFTNLENSINKSGSIKEKRLFIQLIKYFYKLNKRNTFNTTKEQLTVSFNSLMHLMHHFKFLIQPKSKSKSKTRSAPSFLNTEDTFIQWIQKRTTEKRKKEKKITIKKTETTKEIETTKKKETKKTKALKKKHITLKRRGLLLSPKLSPLFIFYKQKWKKYVKVFQKNNIIRLYNLSADFIEEQFYRKSSTYAFIKKNICTDKKIYYINKRYAICEKKRKSASYIYFHKSKRRNENFVFRSKTNRKKKTTQISSINQARNWKKARKITYLVCKHIMKDCYHNRNNSSNSNSNNNNNKNKTQHTIIILNDTFHYPSMRKQYFLLTKKYMFNYVQTFLNTPLKTCLKRNQIRKKFKHISEETIIRNFMYHDKYAIRIKQSEKPIIKETENFKALNIVSSKDCAKWQRKILSLEIKIFNKKQFPSIFFFLYKYYSYFTSVETKRKTALEKENKQEEKPLSKITPLDVLNVMLNKIIHEQLSEVPNEKKEEVAKYFRLIKLDIMKSYRKNPCSVEQIKQHFCLRK